MKFKRFALAVGLSMTAVCPTFGGAEDMPARKAGLWESSMKSGDGKIPDTVIKQCVDAETDKAALMGVASTMCDLKWNRVAPDRIETTTTCKMGPINASGKGVITGDFNSRLKIETTTTASASGEGMPAGAPMLDIPAQTQTMLIEARWLGPCEAGQKPGDIIMPDGKVIQMPALPKK